MIKKSGRRGKGRPQTHRAVGREALIDAARRLLETHPPSKVTSSSIAREAGADPTLIRYHFKNRTALLLAVVEQMLADVPTERRSSDDKTEQFRAHLEEMFRFIGSAKHMHRLMIDELADSPRLRELSQSAISRYSDLVKPTPGKRLRAIDPVFLHLAIVGIVDFYMSAQPIVRSLMPEGSDMDQVELRFRDFITTLLLDGLRER